MRRAEIRCMCEEAEPFFHPGGVEPPAVHLPASDVIRLLDALDSFEQLAEYFELRAEQQTALGGRPASRAGANRAHAQRIRRILEKVDGKGK